MNEIKRQLKLKIGDTTEHQKNVIIKLNNQYPFRSKQRIKTLAPITASIAVLITTIILIFSFNSEENYQPPYQSANSLDTFTIPNHLNNDLVKMKNYLNGETVELPIYMFSSFLDYVKENKYGEQEEVLSALRYIDVKNDTTLNKSFVVTFDCGRTACASAFMIVNEKMQVMTPLGEGTITSDLIYSPDNENVMFLLSNAEKTKQRIVVINFKSNSQSRIPTAYHEYFSYYNWPISNTAWLTNEKISITLAKIESNTNEAIKQWLQKSDKPTHTLEITLPYK
ncbi:hypothetical protein [Cytobacillus praedii]|uniref:hypothetical protein n=1 Tax=Cytobacillus praedii TaxID=1742358 RepID=UPI002E247E7D|nr:hypothetical protein [Cytobacillus praedii]